MPSEYLEPGYIVNYLGGAVSGTINIGRYPSGRGAHAQVISDALSASGFDSSACEDIMRYKYAKLLGNLGNGIQAVCGREDFEANRELAERIRGEGSYVLSAAGISYIADEIAEIDIRWKSMGFGEVDGHGFRGGSTWQSIARGTGNVETDYLNGEIVLLGRQLGIPTPANELIQKLTLATVSARRQPGWRPARELIAELDGHADAVSGQARP
jgi:2-dehydropantoate 2-reductase